MMHFQCRSRMQLKQGDAEPDKTKKATDYQTAIDNLEQGFRNGPVHK